MNTRERITSILRNVTTLPTLPTVATQLLHQADQRGASLKDISAMVERDPAVATRLLKLVNSPFFGIRREVTSVQQALLLVGMSNLRSLVLSSSVLNLFTSSGKVGSFDRAQFWDHCLGVAVCARQIASTTNVVDPDTAFTAGLIHDIGKMIEDRFMHPEFEKVMQHADRTKCTLVEAEQSILGLTHADLGQYIARHWNLPEALQYAIGYHHQPEKAPGAMELAAVICIADEFARASQIGNGGGCDPNPSEAARELAKFAAGSADKLKADIVEAFSGDHAKQLFKK